MKNKFIFLGITSLLLCVDVVVHAQDPVRRVDTSKVSISLSQSTQHIDEVIINTGYQYIPKERATGSFVHLDRARLEGIPGRTVLDKLAGVMPGLYVDSRQVDYKVGGSPSRIQIRGINTFSNATAKPLIIVDNFPYEGELDDLHPDDVESVTMMRDAAATSIWGARAGNGVLVINLKRPEKSGNTTILWSSNLTTTARPDLYYTPAMSASEFVDVEVMLYDRGYYRSSLTGSNAHRTVFSPVVQALYGLEQGLIGQEETDRIISGSRMHDYRDELLRYFYRDAFNQQHHLSLSRHTGWYEFRLSAALDRLEGAGNMRGERTDDRYSFNFHNSFRFHKRFQAELGVRYVRSSTHHPNPLYYPMNAGGGKSNMYPYLRMFDENGNGLAVIKDFNARYVDTVGRGQLMDWAYYPLDELDLVRNYQHSSGIRPSIKLHYNPIGNVKLELFYEGQFNSGVGGTLYDMDSYYVRDQVNRFTQIKGEQVVRPLPIGDIHAIGHSILTGHQGRIQTRIDEKVVEGHYLSGVFGAEIGDVIRETMSNRAYGYDPNLLNAIPVDYITRFPLIYGGTSTIGYSQSFGRGVQRMVSFYANALYSISGKYNLSVSARKDASNVFGVKSNERWNPLWSAGLSWNIVGEEFISPMNWISSLRLRATYGHSGNLGGGTTSDRVILRYAASDFYTKQPYANISTPPNPSLTWENVQMTNLALDFGFFGRRIAGSIEYYRKNVTDIISLDPMDKTTGFTSMTKNVGGIKGEGFDILLNSSPLIGSFQWDIGGSLSHARDWVTVYKGNLSTSSTFVSSGENNILPFIGRHLMSIYSYRFAGLDPQTGDPIGYLNDELSKDYPKLLADSLQNLHYHGSALPLYFGFLNNSFTYKGIGLSANISFRAGHYFRRSTIQYNSLFSSWDTHGDYAKRWQKPGDEQLTTVPSLTYPANSNRDNFYAFSEQTVEKGDVVRLQQIRLSYRYDQPLRRVQRVEVGLSINNLGVLWKAADSWRDPDYQSVPPARVISGNLKIQF